jgi:hypothetical protein
MLDELFNHPLEQIEELEKQARDLRKKQLTEAVKSVLKKHKKAFKELENK